MNHSVYENIMGTYYYISLYTMFYHGNEEFFFFKSNGSRYYITIVAEVVLNCTDMQSGKGRLSARRGFNFFVQFF